MIIRIKSLAGELKKSNSQKRTIGHHCLPRWTVSRGQPYGCTERDMRDGFLQTICMHCVPPGTRFRGSMRRAEKKIWDGLFALVAFWGYQSLFAGASCPTSESTLLTAAHAPLLSDALRLLHTHLSSGNFCLIRSWTRVCGKWNQPYVQVKMVKTEFRKGKWVKWYRKMMRKQVFGSVVVQRLNKAPLAWRSKFFFCWYIRINKVFFCITPSLQTDRQGR